ncbi:uncharacterized protein C8A04DRAFT_15052 [Dichotomopilus funicola]|uniref:Uncharacterized protein n=1 Tax=Dichotomopilus funicola TaxID=1934379 RepID=A0AAN6ZID4_9PEZI|nr:hypothetical protein C8A04DRAFT_15052 [Dichotomopilus funicola]
MADSFPLGSPPDFENENDDLDSLFGGDNFDDDLGGDAEGFLAGLNPTSHFMEVGAAAESSHALDRERTTSLPQRPPQEATNSVPQLALPGRFAELTAANAQPSQQLALPPSAPQLPLPTIPDPPAAFLSRQDGHTSGDFVVSTQSFAFSAPGPQPSGTLAEEEFDEAALEAELSTLFASDQVTNEQPINAQDSGSGPNDAIEVDDDLLTTEIPGFRYKDSATNSFVRLPRRIHLNPNLAEEFNRRTKVDVLYSHLELSVPEGKRFSDELKRALREPHLVKYIEHPNSRGLDTKKLLIRVGLHLLVEQNWGRTWFRQNKQGTPQRKYVWPENSTVLLAGLVMLLYRVYTNQKQMYQIRVRAEASVQSQVQAQMANSGAAPSPSISAPSAPAASTPASPPRAPSTFPAASEGQSFFHALSKDVTVGKKRKHTEALMGLGEEQESELVVPANARLKYYIYVKDKADAVDFMPPTIYRHTDFMISRGAFSSLKAAFEADGHAPECVIQTPHGRKKINTEEEWNAAVLSIYERRRSGGVVEVDVYV